MSKLDEVLCPRCVRPGGLAIFMESYSTVRENGVLSVRQVPILSCSRFRCRLILIGEVQGGDVVFPDPHVEPVR